MDPKERMAAAASGSRTRQEELYFSPRRGLQKDVHPHVYCSALILNLESRDIGATRQAMT